MKKSLFLAAFFGLSSAIACGGGGDDSGSGDGDGDTSGDGDTATTGGTGSGTEGSEGGPCYGNGSCDAGLQCLSDLCVQDPSSMGGADPGAGGTGGSSTGGSGDGSGATGGSNSGGSTGTGGGSSTPLPLPCSDAQSIDNFEDGDNDICQVDGRDHRWFWIGSGVRVPADDPIGTALDPVRGTSLMGVHFAASSTDGSLSGIGTDLDVQDRYDASAYKGVGFWAKGTNGLVMSIGMHTPDSIPTANGGDCTVDCWKGYIATTPLTDSWEYYSLDFTAFMSENKSLPPIDTEKLMGLQFLFTTDFDVWLDDVVFVPH